MKYLIACIIAPLIFTGCAFLAKKRALIKKEKLTPNQLKREILNYTISGWICIVGSIFLLCLVLFSFFYTDHITSRDVLGLGLIIIFGILFGLSLLHICNQYLKDKHVKKAQVPRI